MQALRGIAQLSLRKDPQTSPPCSPFLHSHPPHPHSPYRKWRCLYVGSPNPHRRNVACVQWWHFFALPVPPAMYFFTSFHSLSASTQVASTSQCRSLCVISNSPVGAFQLIIKLQNKSNYTTRAFHSSLSFTLSLITLPFKGITHLKINR